MEEIRYLGRHRTIHCIGDSHALAFDELVFEAAREIYACRTSYLTRTLAQDLLGPDGSLCEPVRSRLFAQSLCIERDGPLTATHASRDQHWQNIEFARDRAFREPVLLFHFGDLDLRFALIPRLAAANDFFLPNPPPGSNLAQVDRAREIVPSATVRDLVRSALEPYLDALRLLKRIGFRHVFAHTMPPQVANDETYGAIYGYAPLALRYKFLHLFNDTLRDLARTRGVGVIDTWAETTTDAGLLNEAYNLDNVHLNTAAARMSIAKVIHAVGSD